MPCVRRLADHQHLPGWAARRAAASQCSNVASSNGIRCADRRAEIACPGNDCRRCPTHVGTRTPQRPPTRRCQPALRLGRQGAPDSRRPFRSGARRELLPVHRIVDPSEQFVRGDLDVASGDRTDTHRDPRPSSPTSARHRPPGGAAVRQSTPSRASTRRGPRRTHRRLAS